VRKKSWKLRKEKKKMEGSKNDKKIKGLHKNMKEKKIKKNVRKKKNLLSKISPLMREPLILFFPNKLK